MKKLREMKKNNKGFSLVELIVVIAIMVVLVAVLGSTILGYIDESKYSKDIQALDAIDTAMSLLVADPGSNYEAAEDEAGATLKELWEEDGNEVIAKTLAEVFTSTGDFNNSSKAFANTDWTTVTIWIKNGAVRINVPATGDFDPYVSPKS